MSSDNATPWADNWPGQCPHSFLSDCRHSRAEHLVWLGEAQPLEEAEGQQAQRGMVAQASPRTAFEMRQTHLLLEFAVRMFVGPASFHDFDQGGECRARRQVAGVVFSLSTSPLFS